MIHTAEPSSIFGNTIFCDDIRHEVDGKVSFIGTYQGGLQVNGPFPATVPKFGFGVSLFQHRTVFSNTLSLRIYFPGDEDDKPSVVSDMDTPTTPPDGQQDTGSFIVMRANLILTGMTLKEPGTIKVRALIKDTLYPLGSLPIAQGPATLSSGQAPTS